MKMEHLLRNAQNDFLVKKDKDINVTKRQYINAIVKISEEE